MKQFKATLVMFTGISLLIAGALAVFLVMDFVTLAETRELLIRLVMVLGIVVVVSAGLLALGRLNHD